MNSPPIYYDRNILPQKGVCPMIKLFKRIVGALTPNKKKSIVFYGPDKPKNMKKGDIWIELD